MDNKQELESISNKLNMIVEELQTQNKLKEREIRLNEILNKICSESEYSFTYYPNKEIYRRYKINNKN